MVFKATNSERHQPEEEKKEEEENRKGDRRLQIEVDQRHGRSRPSEAY